MRRYADLPPEVFFKEDLLRLGLLDAAMFLFISLECRSAPGRDLDGETETDLPPRTGVREERIGDFESVLLLPLFLPRRFFFFFGDSFFLQDHLIHDGAENVLDIPFCESGRPGGG